MYRLIACQNLSRKVMVILPLCDLYEYEIEVVSTIEETTAEETTPKVNEEDPTDQSMHALYAEVNGMDELELSEIMTN